MLFVQIVGLIGLFWYAWETSAMRKAAVDQVEGLSKPCLTLAGELRDPRETLLRMDGAVGSTLAMKDDGNLVVHNIGNGVALNVSYTFSAIDPDKRRNHQSRYFQSVLAGQRLRIPEPAAFFQGSGEYEFTFSFDSIGGRGYQSIVRMNNLVLTKFDFTPKPKPV